ncbi:MAG: ABC transporter permease subunit [Pseudomonadota bacterium]|nr:ABC transporter permease subunit [Pseudomonadota bacterium]
MFLRQIVKHPLTIVGWMVLFSMIICQNQPYLVYYKHQLWFPLFQEVPSELFEKSGINLDFHDPNLQKQIRQHGFMINAPVTFDNHYIDTYTPFLSTPSWQHWLGTDDKGIDVLAQLIIGLRNSIIFGISYSIPCFIIGTLAGSISGYCGGKIDMQAQSLFIVWKSIPLIYLILILKSLTTLNDIKFVLILILCGWGKFFHLARVETLKAKSQNYIKYYKVSGLPETTIFFKHILPHYHQSSMSYLPWHFIYGINTITTAELLGFYTPTLKTIGPLIVQIKHHPEAIWISLSVIVTICLLMHNILNHTQKALQST